MRYIPSNKWTAISTEEFDAPIKLSKHFGCSKIGVHFSKKTKKKVK